MLWQANILVSADADECESQYVPQLGSERNLVDWEVRIELVRSPASEAATAELDLTVAASGPRTAVAWTAVHPAVVVVTKHCSPEDLQRSLE